MIIKSSPLTILEQSSNSEQAVYVYDNKTKNKKQLLGFIWRDNKHLYNGKPIIRYRHFKDPMSKIRGNTTSEIGTITQLIDYITRYFPEKLL